MNMLCALSLAIALALTAAGCSVTANPPINTVGADAVGRWLCDPDGAVIGSVRSLSTDGRTANVMIGSYFEPGSHEVQVPIGSLSVAGDKAVLQQETLQALNGLHR